jgi:hypothetical protein
MGVGLQVDQFAQGSSFLSASVKAFGEVEQREGHSHFP